MPVNQYSVLKGTPVSGSLNQARRPHYLIEVNAGGAQWQIAVNVESDTGSGASAEVLYKLDENWAAPDPSALAGLPAGVTPLAGVDADPAVDYLRSRVNGQPLVTRAELAKLPLPGRGASGSLQNAVVRYLNEAVADPNGTVYAFGALYTTGQGIHDIHMNQGNPAGDHSGDNGVWQDGLLVFNMPSAPKWVAVYVAFQEQVWDTDGSGNAVAGAVGGTLS